LLALASGLHAEDDSSSLPRHPLERQALVDPQAALVGIEAALVQAEASDDLREQALLQLARANACRVVADWPCQRNAGMAASRFGAAVDDPVLKVRGLIAEARAAMAMQDYSLGEQRLASAEIVLRQHPNPELQADVALGYSSMSHSLGKHAVAADYAARGLAALRDPERALPMRVRLLRNQARALAQLGELERARALLQQAAGIVEHFEDPKLSAELNLEQARLARLDGDYRAQIDSGRAVMTLGETLRNSQLLGLGREVIALAELDAGNRAEAIGALSLAYTEFQQLKLHRDQLRVGRLLLLQLIEQEGVAEPVNGLIRELMALEENVIQADRAQSAAEFQSRLDFVQQQAEVDRLEAEARVTEQRAQRLIEIERMSRWLAWATLAGLLILLVFFVGQRMSNQRLKRTLRELRESRTQAREFLGLSSGLVCLHDLDGRIVDLNPSAAQALGVAGDTIGSMAGGGMEPPGEARPARNLVDHVIPTPEADIPRYLASLRSKAHTEGTLRFRRADGSHAHWRYSSRALGEHDARRLALLQAVDVTDQVQQTEEFRSMALHDPLTGCFNRRYLGLFELQQREQGWTALVIDLDQFKRVNDERGHEYGDHVLREFGAFLKSHARSEDAVVRSGGDEFILLLPQPDQEGASSLLQRLQEDAASASSAFSMGFAVRNGSESLASTIDRADRNMYRHKDRRKGRAEG
jgi:diguanylate cyclase (GGDEF)-like protein